MKLVKATEQDSADLVTFYLDTPFSRHLEMKILKKNSFFEQYQIQSDDFVTYMLVDESKQRQVQALVTLVFREAWVLGEKTIIAYATDLRVLPQRNVILQWTNYLLPILQEEREKRNCKYIFSVVAEAQSQAFNAFIRPRTHRRELPRYFLFRRFDIVGLHGLLPFAPAPLKTITTRFANNEDLPSIAEYVAIKMREKPLQFNNSSEVFMKNFARWSQLDVSDFILAIDRSNKIVGCTAVWNNSNIESFIPTKYDSKTLTLKEALHFLSFFGLAKRLSNIQDRLKFKTLSFLLADNPDIFYSLLHKAYRSADREHFLIYPHFEGSLLTQPPKSFISSHLRAGLYCILTPGDPVPDFLKPKVLSASPDFDLAFL